MSKDEINPRSLSITDGTDDTPSIKLYSFSYVFTLRKLLHGPSMLAVKAKIYGVLYKQSSSIAFDETSSYWSALKSS